MTKTRPALHFLPLGGAGEIGMNLNLFQWRDSWLMVDLGITFGDDMTPGVDVILPDATYIEKRRDKLAGLVVTHAHEDHIGAVSYLWPRLRCPIYATSFTASVLRRKLADAGLAKQAEITVVRPDEPFSVGPFGIELVRLTHSIPEPNALVIRTDHGAIFHTGDWKIDPDPLIGEPIDEAALRRIGDAGVMTLIGDSTNVFKEGRSGSEGEVRASLIELVKTYEHRVAIAFFASNVARLETVAKVAEATGREAGLVGRSLWRMYEAARENGYLADIRPFLPEDEIMRIPRERALVACTGSQGEPRAALMRIASGNHPKVRLEKGDTVIFSSRIIPGNEKSIGRLQDALWRIGVDIVTEEDHFVHVSGHPARDELIDMYQWIRPAALVPVHGEVRHLHEHRELAKACQIGDSIVAVNGDIVRLAPGKLSIVERVQSGRLAVDGSELVPMEGDVLRERRHILHNGAVVVSVVIDTDGDLLAEPIITMNGLAEDDGYDDLYETILDAAENAIDNLGPAQLREDNAVAEAVRKSVRGAVRAARGLKPSTDVHVTRLD